MAHLSQLAKIVSYRRVFGGSPWRQLQWSQLRVLPLIVLLLSAAALCLGCDKPHGHAHDHSSCGGHGPDRTPRNERGAPVKTLAWPTLRAELSDVSQDELRRLVATLPSPVARAGRYVVDAQQMEAEIARRSPAGLPADPGELSALLQAAAEDLLDEPRARDLLLAPERLAVSRAVAAKIDAVGYKWDRDKTVIAAWYARRGESAESFRRHTWVRLAAERWVRRSNTVVIKVEDEQAWFAAHDGAFVDEDGDPLPLAKVRRFVHGRVHLQQVQAAAARLPTTWRRRQPASTIILLSRPTTLSATPTETVDDPPQ